MNLTATIKFKDVASILLPETQLECSLNKIKIPNTGLIAHFKRNFKKQKWERYNERALVFFFIQSFMYKL